jgi:lipid-A-disaccharide synthase-like uncharacterized protein
MAEERSVNNTQVGNVRWWMFSVVVMGGVILLLLFFNKQQTTVKIIKGSSRER